MPRTKIDKIEAIMSEDMPKATRGRKKHDISQKLQVFLEAKPTEYENEIIDLQEEQPIKPQNIEEIINKKLEEFKLEQKAHKESKAQEKALQKQKEKEERQKEKEEMLKLIAGRESVLKSQLLKQHAAAVSQIRQSRFNF